MITITQLEYLLAVDKHRNFGKAAKEAHVTQPTLSMQLKKLEEDLGFPVFDRTKKPILPTEDGKAVIDQARRVVDEWKRLSLFEKSGGKELTGELRIAVIPTLAPYWIPLFIEDFSKRHPKLTLRIDELQTHQILKALDQDEIDAGLLVTPLGSKALHEEPLFYEPFYLWIRRDHELASKTRIGEGDLDGGQLWLLNEGHCFRNQMLQICSLSKRKTLLKNVTFESGNLETLKRLVERNGGYTLVPELALPEKTPREIEVRAFRRPMPAREVSLVYRRLQWKMPQIRALKEVLLECVPRKLRELKRSEFEVIGIEG